MAGIRKTPHGHSFSLAAGSICSVTSSHYLSEYPSTDAECSMSCDVGGVRESEALPFTAARLDSSCAMKLHAEAYDL